MADYCTHTFRKITSSYNWANGSPLRSYWLQCKCCGFKWTVHYDTKLNKEVIATRMSDSRILNQKKLTETEVRLILTDERSGAELAKVLGVTHQAVNQVRTGKTHQRVLPELPRVVPEVRNYKRMPIIRSTKITCQDCAHWWQKRCSLDVPEAGGTFAIECSFYQVDD